MSTLPSECELQGMRAAQESILPDTAAIYSYVSASDGLGGRTETWVQVQASVPCRISEPSAREEREVAEREMIPGTAFMLTTPYGTDLKVRDRVVVDTITYEVLYVVTEKNLGTADRQWIGRL